MANVDDLIDAIAKLRWAVGGDFSVPLRPCECEALLAVLPDKDLVITSLTAADERVPRHLPEFSRPEILSGDPGDEQPS